MIKLYKRHQRSRGPFAMPSTNFLRKKGRGDSLEVSGRIFFMERNAGVEDKISCNKDAGMKNNSYSCTGHVFICLPYSSVVCT